jgi:hypothetical protein
MTDFGGARISDHAHIGDGAAQGQRGAAAASAAGAAGGIPANRPGRVVLQGHVTPGDPPLKAFLRVIVEVGLDPPEVVTLYATTKFRRYGAKP